MQARKQEQCLNWLKHRSIVGKVIFKVRKNKDIEWKTVLQTANVKLNDIFNIWSARLIFHLKHAFYWLLNKQAH